MTLNKEAVIGGPAVRACVQVKAGNAAQFRLFQELNKVARLAEHELRDRNGQ